MITPGLPLLDPEFTRSLMEMEQDCIALRNINVAAPLGVRYMPGVGLFLYLIEQPATSATSEESVRFIVKEIFNDYLRCRTWLGGVEGGEDYYIAKPPELRHDVNYYPQLSTITTTDEQTVEASDGATDETWVVTPSYRVDQQIYANIPSGGTGITVGADALLWLDENRAGRAWAVQL